MASDTAFYLPLACPDGADPSYEYFTPTEATMSVWSPELQHGGPPTGLLSRALINQVGGRDGYFSRVTTDILGAVGYGINRVRAQVIRPGRQISVIGAELDVAGPDGTFRTAARASAWLLSGADTTAISSSPVEPLRPLPDDLDVRVGMTLSTEGSGVDWGTVGFIGQVETANVAGRNGATSALWIRPRFPLVAGEETSDLASAFTVIDVANGVGTQLNPQEWTWMNTDTTVHFIRPPRGTWIGLDSELSVGPNGFGATYCDLYDADGFIGRSAQTLLLVAR